MKRIFTSHLFLSFIFIFVLMFSILFNSGKLAYSADELCTGDFRTNLVSAQDCIAKAIAQGEARGYEMSCKVEQLGLGGFTDPTSGKDYILNPVCTVNNSPGHGAYTLVGFSAMPKCTTEQLQRIQASGSSDTFASEGCSNSIIIGVNPGWDILKTELGYESAFYQCGGKTPYASVVNGVNVYSCTDPNPPRITPGISPVINPVSGTTGGTSGTSGDTIKGCTGSTGVSTITGESCAGTVYTLDRDNDGIPDNIDDEVDNGGTLPRIVATVVGGTTPGTSVCSVLINSGIQNGAYRYTFKKSSEEAWTVSLNNPAYSISTDKYYVPANYSFLVTSASELNIRSQGRFNHLESLPGTAVGNTEYNRIFGSFVNAYYDWDNMTKNAVASCATNVSRPVTVSPPSISTQPVLVGVFPIASFPVEVVVIVQALNTRTGPYTTSPLASSRPLRIDSTFTATGWVYGESVSGINVWYVSTNGNYIWSGGTRKVTVSH